MVDAHRDHDLGPIVAFADGELTGAEWQAATAQVESCAECADLVADLVALTMADRTMITPPRPRDLRLTAADAARLVAVASEPEAETARLGTEMTKLPAALSEHPAHDPMLIAAAVDGTLERPDRARTDAWLSRCSACADLHRDLLAIASANRALPTPPRPRDFRLTPRDAERARGRGLRGLLARIGSPRDGFSRPLAAGLTTLGLAGLILSGGSSLLATSSTGAAGETILSTVGAALPEQNSKGSDLVIIAESTDMPGVFSGEGDSAGSVVSAAPVAAEAAPQAPDASLVPRAAATLVLTDDAGLAAGDPTISPSAVAADANTRQLSRTGSETESTSGPSASVVISLVMLIIGLALFAGRWVVRRRTAT